MEIFFLSFIALIVLFIVLMVSSYDATPNNYSNKQSSTVANRANYPANLIRMMEQLPDTDMHTVVDYAVQKGLRFICNDMAQGIEDSELNEALDYIQKYKRFVPNSEVFCFHEYICSTTNQAFIDIFRARPELLFRKQGLVETSYFINQFEIYCGNQVQTFGDDEDEDVGYAYFLDNWGNYPALEAEQCGMSIEQTNWHEVLKWLSERVNDHTYITYPLRYAQELTRINDVDLHFVGDFACRVMADESYINNDIDQTKEFVRKFLKCSDTNLEEMSKYASTITVASTSFIKVFMLKPELLYKDEGLIKLRDFTSQLDVECQNQSYDYSTGDTNYQMVCEKEREYRDTMLSFPAMEARYCNIPVEQTNWHEVVRQLSARVDD